MLSADSKVLLADGRFKRANGLQAGDVLFNPVASAPHPTVARVANAARVPFYTLKHRSWYTPSKLMLTHRVLVQDGQAQRPRFVAVPDLGATWHAGVAVRTPRVAPRSFASATDSRPPITPSYHLGYVLGTALASSVSVSADAAGEPAPVLVLDDPVSRSLLVSHFRTVFPRLATPATTTSSKVTLDPAIMGLLRAFQTNPARTVADNSHSPQLLLGIRDGIVHNTLANMHTQLSVLAMECVYLIDMLLPHATESPIQAFIECTMQMTEVVRCTFDGHPVPHPVLMVDNMVLAL